MELAVIATNKILSMFLLILVGVMCYKTKLIKRETNAALSQILLLIITPLMIFTSYQREFNMEQLKGLVITIGLAAAVHILGIVFAAVLIRKKANPDFEVETMSAIYSNCGFMGLPLVYGIFGSDGVFYMTAYITVFNVFLWTHGVVLMTGKQSLKATAKALVTPSTIAIAVGLICYIGQLRLPAIVAEPMTMIADMNTPVAMLVSGVSLASSNLLSMLKKKRVYYICFLKHLLIPLAASLLMKRLPFDEIIITTVVLAACCPVGSTTTLFALRYKKNDIYSAELFGVSTVLSIVTIPVTMIVFKLL